MTSGPKIPEAELTFRAARGGGPGGQHVNKTSTKVQLRWNIAASSALAGAVKARMLALFGNRINSDGELMIECDETRSQQRNREICIERLQKMLARAATPPKRRRKTKPGKATQQRRRQARERLSQKKAARRKPEF